VVDLTGVDLVDSSGLGALGAGVRTARHCAGGLRITASGYQVRTVPGLTNLDRVLRNHGSVEDALDGW
jgi:anti-sigma B factor antagonist